MGDFAACLHSGRDAAPAKPQLRRRGEAPGALDGAAVSPGGEREWLFLRFYDYEADELISFNIVNLRREGDKSWEERVMTTPLRPLLQEETVRLLGKAGFTEITCYGDMGGGPFNPETSGNLVVVARLAA